MNDFKINPGIEPVQKEEEMVVPLPNDVAVAKLTPIEEVNQKPVKDEVINWHKNRLDNLQRQIEDHKMNIKVLQDVVHEKQSEASILE